jgi:ABC-type Fe3+ transport system permease subunit
MDNRMDQDDRERTDEISQVGRDERPLRSEPSVGTRRASRSPGYRTVTVIRTTEKASSSQTAWRWIWLMVALVAIVVIYVLLSNAIHELAGVNHSIQDQTGAIREQNQILSGIKDSMNSLILAIKDAVNSILLAITG